MGTTSESRSQEKQPPDRELGASAPGPPPTGALLGTYLEAELAVTARQIELGFFRGLDGKALTVKEAAERMERSERYLRWRWGEGHG